MAHRYGAEPAGVPVLRSMPTTDGIAALVARRYDLVVTACTLIRSFVNDVWEVGTSAGRFVLKLYRHGGWSVDEVGWEVDLVTQLARAGVPVAPVRPMPDGQAVGELTAPEGVRPFVLVEHVDGVKPAPPFDDDLYRSVGALLGRLHEAADVFGSGHRRRLGPYGDLTETLARVGSALAGEPGASRMVADLGARARVGLDELAAQMEWGVRHGDVTMDNVVLTDAGPVIYDFDLAQPGWRVADLGGCLATPFAEAFLTGYTSVRPVGDADLAALPWLRVVEVVRNLDFHLTQKPLWRGRESLGEGWVADGLAELAETARGLR